MTQVVQWEYQFVSLPQHTITSGDAMKKLNELGLQGWELIGTYQLNYAIMKRALA